MTESGDLAHPEAESRIAELEVRDLRARIDRRRRDGGRHLLWALLGASPAAAVPMLLGLSEVGPVAVIVIGVLVTATEGWRALQAHMDAAALEERLAAREEAGDP